LDQKFEPELETSLVDAEVDLASREAELVSMLLKLFPRSFTVWQNKLERSCLLAILLFSIRNLLA